MIRKNIYQALTVFIVAIASTVYLSAMSQQSQSIKDLEQSLSQLSAIYSQISSSIEQVDWQSDSADQTLMDKLRSIPEVKSSEIISADRRVLLKQPNRALNRNNHQITSHLYLPINNGSASKTLSFVIEIESSSTPLLNQTTMFVIAFWGAMLAAFLFYRFNWVQQLESYARHVLVAENNHPLETKNRFHNVIGHAINQLILNNRHLTKAKATLAEKIRKTSYIDEVTELGNHLFFKAELQVRLHNHDEAEEGIVAILAFVDADTKNSVLLDNEQQIAVASLLKVFVEDIEQSLVVRLKEAEFALLLPNFTADQTDQFCKKLIDQLSKSLFDNQRQSAHFVDIGISTYKQGFGYYNIMSEADMALRNAQLQGANSWFVYGEPLPQHKSKGSLRWRNFLQKILERREIMLFSQQLHYFNGETRLHREILSRIADGNDILSADRFLVMANQCGLAVDFDRQIIDSVLKHLLYQRDKVNDHLYSINIFITSLLDSRFTHWLIGKLSSYPELSKQLIFELPENQISKHIDSIGSVMQQISSLGVRWGVEHFGSPEDNLEYLDKVSISMVKIDRRIINNISCDKAKQLLLTSIIVTLKSRNIKIFAEGVEKSLDANYLKQIGIDGAQGYHFDNPHRLDLEEQVLEAV